MRTCYSEESQESGTVIAPLILQESISNIYIKSNATGTLFTAALQSLQNRETNENQHRLSSWPLTSGSDAEYQKQLP